MDIYHKLREKLDGMSNGFPATESGIEMEILRDLFTEEQETLYIPPKTGMRTYREIAQYRNGNP